MILRLLHAGKPSRGPLSDAADDYRKRLSRATPADEVFVKPHRLSGESAAEVAKALATEGERLLARVGDRDRLVALRIGREGMSSKALAGRLRAWRQGGFPAVCFALGSAHGLDSSVLARAHETLCFGPMTLPHDLARVVLWEQLYRANSIISGSPYHK